MSDFLQLCVVALAAVGPASAVRGVAAALPDTRRRICLAALACATSFAVIAVAIAAREPLLTFLDISAETFWIAAGLLMMPPAAAQLWWGSALHDMSRADWRAALVPLAVPRLAGPAAIAFSVAEAEREGAAATLGAVSLALLLTWAALAAAAWLQRGLRTDIIDLLARFSGMVLAIAAVELIAAGVETV